MENQQPAGEEQNSQKKAWYKSGWGLVVAILFFPYFLLWFMWAKTSWSKGIKIAITIVFAIINIVALSSDDTTTKNTQQTNQQVEQKPVVAETKTEVKNEVPAEPVKPLATTDKLWNALDKSIKTRTSYDIKYDEAKKEATLIFSPKDFWDENSVVKGAYSTLVKYGKEVFQIDGVNSLTVNYKLEFTDRYGKKSTDDAVIITMSKDEFSKYDWDNLKYQPVYNQIKSSASKYYVHPALESKLDYSKLYLAL